MLCKRVSLQRKEDDLQKMGNHYTVFELEEERRSLRKLLVKAQRSLIGKRISKLFRWNSDSD